MSFILRKGPQEHVKVLFHGFHIKQGSHDEIETKFHMHAVNSNGHFDFFYIKKPGWFM